MTNPTDITLNRRKALQLGLGLSGAAAALTVAGRGLAADRCQVTPAQTEGPFFPVESQLDEDADLTFVKGGAARATGQVIYITGTVKDSQCAPIAGALLEIWQACASGRYKHPGDTNPAPLDPNFQYWGRAATDAQGRYVFKTILPGAYPADTNWMRPPHIHFKISKRGYRELTTQLYFAGNRYNDADLILQALSAEEQRAVITALKPSTVDFEAGSQTGVFDVSLVRF